MRSADKVDIVHNTFRLTCFVLVVSLFCRRFYKFESKQLELELFDDHAESHLPRNRLYRLRNKPQQLRPKATQAKRNNIDSNANI